MAADATETEFQEVRTAGEIARLLKRMHAEHALLTVRFPHEPETFSSAVIDVEAQRASYRLDELCPGEGHARVGPGTRLRVEARLDGVETRFVAEVREVGLDRGIYFYDSSFPELIHYRQRRLHHREPWRVGEDGVIRLLADDALLPARLLDISAGGLGGVVLPPHRLDPDTEYTCELCLGDGSGNMATIVIRHVRHLPLPSVGTAGRERFGAMFKNLSPADRRLIERLVATLERERLKRS